MQRNRSYDIIRVVAIVMVICIHCMMPLRDSLVVDSLSINNWICSLCYSIISAGVPMFFMLSGALLLGRNEKWTDFYKKRLKRIIVPFVLWSGIVYGLSFFVNHPNDIGEYISNFLVLLCTKGVNEAYWFVYMLLGFYLITPLIQALLRKWNNYSLWCCILVGGYLLWFFLPDFFPSLFSFCRWMCYLSFYVGGYLLSQVIKPINKWVLSICIVVLVACNTMSMVYQWVHLPWTLLYATSLFGLLNQVYAEDTPEDDSIALFSRNSYGVYLSHVIICGILLRIPWYVQHIPLTIQPLLSVCIVVGIEYAMMFVLEKLGWNKWLC